MAMMVVVRREERWATFGLDTEDGSDGTLTLYWKTMKEACACDRANRAKRANKARCLYLATMGVCCVVGGRVHDINNWVSLCSCVSTCDSCTLFFTGRLGAMVAWRL